MAFCRLYASFKNDAPQSVTRRTLTYHEYFIPHMQSIHLGRCILPYSFGLFSRGCQDYIEDLRFKI